MVIQPVVSAPDSRIGAVQQHEFVAQISLSAFSFLFGELVQYCQTQVSNIGELERRSATAPSYISVIKLAQCLCALIEQVACRLEDSGYGIGLRLLEVLSYRERNSRREVRLLEMLKFVHTSLWKCLFGRQARELEQSNTVSTLIHS